MRTLCHLGPYASAVLECSFSLCWSSCLILIIMVFIIHSLFRKPFPGHSRTQPFSLGVNQMVLLFFSEENNLFNLSQGIDMHVTI